MSLPTGATSSAAGQKSRAQLPAKTVGPYTEEQIAQLVEQNDELRARLKDFNLALDRALRSTSNAATSTSKASANVRMFASVQDQELANAYKRMDILRKENDALKATQSKDSSAPRLAELENEVKAAKDNERKALEEVKTLALELKRARKTIADAPEALSALQAREASTEETLRKYREQFKIYRARHDQDERFMRSQQQTMLSLIEQLRASKSSFVAPSLPQLPPALPVSELEQSLSDPASKEKGSGAVDSSVVSARNKSPPTKRERNTQAKGDSSSDGTKAHGPVDGSSDDGATRNGPRAAASSSTSATNSASSKSGAADPKSTKAPTATKPSNSGSGMSSSSSSSTPAASKQNSVAAGKSSAGVRGGASASASPTISTQATNGTSANNSDSASAASRRKSASNMELE